MVRLIRLTRTGHSVGITVPHELVSELKWTRGDLLAAGLVDGALVVRRYDEARLLEAPAPTRGVRMSRKGRR